MRRFLIIITLILGAGYMGYGWFIDYAVALNKEKCVAAVAGNDIFGTNNDELCSCVSGFVRENPFFDKESMDFKAKFGAQLKSCLDVHVARYGIKQCDDLKIQIRQHYHRNLDCVCFAEAVIDIAVDSWFMGSNTIAGKESLGADVLKHCTK